MTDIRKLLASNMKTYRKLQGISQAKLAEKINTATNYIAMIEVGKKFPSAAMLERIATALNVDTPELFTAKAVKIMPVSNQSIERLYQDILDDFQQFEDSVIKRIKNLQP
jgi:transcriptional regulator with XRE-family HTH domain